ncbi:hypothetical protein [Duncaniella muris]|uniref:hypothetical protein n=1 Tax=Duncaniella muris TaxID=2094150 RepID=UPI00272BF9D2|nr:hypothetical protein [Duncaniella muris]
MHIYVNNKLAALKKGTSFEYVSENRMFSGSDGYTLTITFPLKGCPENIAIFGHINRADVVAQKVIFDCEIRDKSFYKFGSITITEISETEVKTQFLEGRSEQNFDKTFDKVYINELDLGAPPSTSTSRISPANAWYPEYSGCKCVALPWVNDYSGNIQNLADYVVDDASQNKGHFAWNAEKCTGLSWQPYLLYITKKICEAVGYTPDFSRWEEVEEYKYLLICNTLPFAWYMPDFANALPHWTVEEYFEKLELFLGGEFDFDHRGKRISFAFTQATLAAKKPVCLENVIEEHSTEVKVDEDRCEYLESKNLVYKDCDHEMWKFYSCDWFVKGWQNRVVRYNSMRELLAANKGYATWDGQHHRDNRIDKLLYAADCDAYFIIRPISRTQQLVVHAGRLYLKFIYKCRLQPVNLFGGRIASDEDDAEQVEIEFVPAWIDDTEDKYGRILFLSFSGYDEDNTISGEDESKYPFLKTHTLSSLEAGEKDKKAEYYDRIYIGWYDGSNHYVGHRLPYPNVEDIAIADDWSNFAYVHFSLRINDRKIRRNQVIHNIDPKKKTTFKFLADNISDVRSVFLIRGKRYICEKITATFTENGMSQLLKGVFYPIVES